MYLKSTIQHFKHCINCYAIGVQILGVGETESNASSNQLF